MCGIQRSPNLGFHKINIFIPRTFIRIVQMINTNTAELNTFFNDAPVHNVYILCFFFCFKIGKNWNLIHWRRKSWIHTYKQLNWLNVRFGNMFPKSFNLQIVSSALFFIRVQFTADYTKYSLLFLEKFRTTSNQKVQWDGKWIWICFFIISFTYKIKQTNHHYYWTINMSHKCASLKYCNAE